MRGAALKVGQMLSIQDESLLPPQLQKVLERVRDSADVMPRRQLERALNKELTPDWQSKLTKFDWTPIAAASIGQVHRAVLPSGKEIVLKVQYPGVAESINSDVNNVKLLVRLFNVMPRGMYFDETMAQAKAELAIECDYQNEAKCQKRYKTLVEKEKRLSANVHVPGVIDDLCTQRVLATEFVAGVPIDRLAIGNDYGFNLSQDERNHVGSTLLRLCLTELFQFRFMQTDPNWSNFLYDPATRRINLIDFGASREYAEEFIDEYLKLIDACANKDREGVLASSRILGFLTGDESREMNNAHVEASFIVGEPFAPNTARYDFATNNIASRISKLAAVMLKLRLTPPPQDAYSLHRRLSGAYLSCKKLSCNIECRSEFVAVRDAWCARKPAQAAAKAASIADSAHDNDNDTASGASKLQTAS